METMMGEMVCFDFDGVPLYGRMPFPLWNKAVTRAPKEKENTVSPSPAGRIVGHWGGPAMAEGSSGPGFSFIMDAKADSPLACTCQARILIWFS
jgi:hypothetical protein